MSVYSGGRTKQPQCLQTEAQFTIIFSYPQIQMSALKMMFCTIK